MRTSTWIMLIGSFLLCTALSYILLNPQQIQSQRTFSSASINPLIRQIMVVDMHQIGVFDEKTVLSGQLPIIAIQNGPDPSDYRTMQFGFLDEVGRLLAFDSTSNGRIDNLDPIYNQLDLVYLTPGQINQIIPIADAGIRTIYLDKNHLTPTELYPNGPKGYWQVVNTVVLGDGSTRSVRVIPVNASALPGSN